jgi:serine-aspartate repeat-containing protein C/D/E
MGLLNTLANLPRRWFSHRDMVAEERDRKRRCLFESMEPRHMLNAAPIHLGVVYFEEDSGADHHGDTFEILFEGGAPGTKLKQLVIDGDHGPAGLSFGDMIFDTAKGGLGADEAFNFQIVSADGIGRVTATVHDGGTRLVLDFEGFDAGEKLLFSIDVDEVQDFTPGETNLDLINQGLDPIASGVEFQGSHLSATFTAPHYHEAASSGDFRNVYDPLFSGSQLLLSSGNAQGLRHDDAGGQRDRSAGTMLALQQRPLPVSIAGTVYLDANLNLRQESGEAGLAGVQLTLWKKVGNDYVVTGHTTTTDRAGNYAFDHSLGLTPGTYQIRQTQPDGLFSVGAVPGSVAGTPSGSAVVDDRNVLTEIAIPLGGTEGIRYDFAEAAPVGIGGSVYVDANNNGYRDPGERGIAGVRVNVVALAAIAPQAVATLTTDAQGNYVATGLAPGSYRILEVFQPEGYFDGLDRAGTVGGVVHGGAANPGDRIEGISLNSGDLGVNYNFGELEPGTIRGRVHLTDREGNCESTTEILPPVVGAIVRLRDAQGNLLHTTTTNAQGEYQFSGLAPGVYTVEEVTPAGLIDGGDHIGTIGGAKVGQKTANDVIGNIVIGSGQHAIDYDFCEHLPASLAGFVYHDQNHNGRRDAEEAAIAGSTVLLFDAHGMQVGTTSTDANGLYLFSGLGQGTYRAVQVQPSGWIDGRDSAGTVNGVTVGTAVNPGDEIGDISLLWGDAGLHYNFGELRSGSIEGIVHIDLIRNCLVDPGEAGVSGVTVQLLNASGQMIASAITDAQGKYRFEGLNPGEYAVREVQPAGTFHGGQAPGSGGGSESTDLLFDIQLGSGQELVDYNFCELPPSVLSGYVFQDGGLIFTPDGRPPANLQVIRDGRLTTDDTRLAGVVLELRNALTGEAIRGEDALPGTYPPGPIRVVTDGSGFYQFRGLPAGSYAVIQMQPAGYVDGLDTPGTQGGFAVNPHTNLNPMFLQPFAVAGVNVGTDAILRIPLGYGEVSAHNDFSEVQVVAEPETPILPPPEVVVTPRPPHAVSPFLYAMPGIDLPQTPGALRTDNYTPYTGGGDYTWHLSVVNGGSPRGNARSFQADASSMMRAASLLRDMQWQTAQFHAGEWNLPAADDELRSSDFGLAGATPLTGDFNGDGITELALFLDGEWFLDANGNGRWDEHDLWAKLGAAGDRPVVGDWDGDGRDDIGIFGPQWERDHVALAHEPGLPDAENQLRHNEIAQAAEEAATPVRTAKNMPPTAEQATEGLRDLQHTQRGIRRSDLIDHVFQLGAGSDVPIAGDFNGDGIDSLGIYRGGNWRLDVDGDGKLTSDDRSVKFGAKNDIPVVGDFDGDGIDEIGIFRDGKWIIDSNHNGEIDAADQVFELGGAGDTPIVGDFNGDGIDEPGTTRTQGPAAHIRRAP